MKKKILTTVALAIFAGNAFWASAHDFEVSMKSGNVFYVNVLDTLLKTAELTYAGEYSRPDSVTVKGLVSIPEIVKYNGKDYRIVKIGTKAFCAGNEIESVILPASVKTIGDFAFEGCTSLKSIVFPGSQVKIGDGAFWNCTNIEGISFGSDWTEVNLEHFKWSTALKTVEIPARVRKIVHLRSVKSLENINVDAKNSAFSSVDGLLYSGNKSTLYTCPVGHMGKIVVPDGVKSILRGAFLECRFVESVELPASIENLSFVDFEPLISLKSLILKSGQPAMTAKSEGKEVFALKLAPSAVLYVPKKAVKVYSNAVCASAGVYESIDGKDKAECRQEELLSADRIKKM